MTGSRRASLRRPAGLSGALLLLGTTAIVARHEVVMRAGQWLGHRDELRQIAAGRSWRLAHGRPADVFPSVPAPGPLHLHDLLLQALPVALTLLIAGALSLALVATGRRVLWAPVALAGLSLHTNVVYLRFGNVDDQAVPALTASMLVILLAAVPILRHVRGVRFEVRTPNRLLIPAMVVVGLLFAQGVRTYGPWYAGDSDIPEVAPAFALFVFAALVVAGPLRRRWLAPMLLAPLLALPPLGTAVVTFLDGYAWDATDLTGVFLGAAFMLALGAVTPSLARMAVALWRRLPAGPARKTAGATT